MSKTSPHITFKLVNCVVCDKVLHPIKNEDVIVISNTCEGACFKAYINMQLESHKKNELTKGFHA